MHWLHKHNMHPEKSVFSYWTLKKKKKKYSFRILQNVCFYKRHNKHFSSLDLDANYKYYLLMLSEKVYDFYQ
jgi:hypothetical protein